MPQLKLQVKKVGSMHPVTRKLGAIVRVMTNGTVDFDDVVKEAGKNTTMHRAELRMAFELCLDTVTEMLKEGYIVDLGVLGKVYPSCTSSWYEKAEDIKLNDVKPSLYFRPSAEVEAAIKSAKLVWAKGNVPEEDKEEESSDEPSGDTPAPTPTPDPSGDDGDMN